MIRALTDSPISVLHRSDTITLTLRGRVEREDLDALCSDLDRFLRRSGARRLCCDVGEVQADAVVVDALARLQLVARRRGCRLTLVDPSSELRELVGLMGLGEVLPG